MDALSSATSHGSRLVGLGSTQGPACDQALTVLGFFSRSGCCRVANAAVNERDAGLAIEIGADFDGFVAVDTVRPQVEEKFGPIEVLSAGDRGGYMPAEQTGGEAG